MIVDLSEERPHQKSQLLTKSYVTIMLFCVFLPQNMIVLHSYILLLCVFISCEPLLKEAFTCTFSQRGKLLPELPLLLQQSPWQLTDVALCKISRTV